MKQHQFASKLLLTGRNKNGTPRLRVSIGTRDYEFITYTEPDLKYLSSMILKRTNGQEIKIAYPRISKGTTMGKYTPHYISVRTEDVKAYDLQVNEPVMVQIEW